MDDDTNACVKRFTIGDRVRVDIPVETDIDHEQYHGKVGVIADVMKDAGSDATGDPRDDYLYTVDFGNEMMDFRWRDLRHP